MPKPVHAARTPVITTSIAESAPTAPIALLSKPLCSNFPRIAPISQTTRPSAANPRIAVPVAFKSTFMKLKAYRTPVMTLNRMLSDVAFAMALSVFILVIIANTKPKPASTITKPPNIAPTLAISPQDMVTFILLKANMTPVIAASNIESDPAFPIALVTFRLDIMNSTKPSEASTSNSPPNNAPILAMSPQVIPLSILLKVKITPVRANRTTPSAPAEPKDCCHGISSSSLIIIAISASNNPIPASIITRGAVLSPLQASPTEASMTVNANRI